MRADRLLHTMQWFECNGGSATLPISASGSSRQSRQSSDNNVNPVSEDEVRRVHRTPVERVSSFKYLGVNISEDLTWTTHIQTQVKKARQRLYHLATAEEIQGLTSYPENFLFRGHRKCSDSVHLSVV